MNETVSRENGSERQGGITVYGILMQDPALRPFEKDIVLRMDNYFRMRSRIAGRGTLRRSPACPSGQRRFRAHLPIGIISRGAGNTNTTLCKGVVFYSGES